MDRPLDALVGAVHEALRRSGTTLACAESLTGGDLAAVVSAPAGASTAFVGAVVSYATAVKRELLGVTAAAVVSGECAEQMAVGVRRVLGSDWALATTGVAGPDSQEGRPVGTVYVGLAGATRCRSVALDLDGDRAAIRAATCRRALEELLDELG